MKAVYVLSLICILLTACGGSSTAIPTSTESPIVLPTSTQTLTPVPPPTNTLEPTVTLAPTIDPNAHPIFQAGSLTSGYGMGVNSSGGLTNWLTVTKEEMCMAYPDGQDWGAVFITVGEPQDPPMASQDLSEYKRLSIEIRGEKGSETVLVGVKDITQPNNGSETKIRTPSLTTDWSTVEFSLAEFIGADISRLYVVTEFVFEKNIAESICVRNIQFVR